MSELKDEYAGRIEFEVKPLSDAPDLNAELFPNGKHGLILRDPDGKIVGTLEGHRYGKTEIVELSAKVL